MTKKEIRKVYREKRSNLSAGEIDRLQDLILIRFQSLHADIPDVVMTFAAMLQNNEYDPVLIEEYCFFKNPAMNLLYPVMNSETGSLTAHLVKEDTIFEKNDYSIDEPINGTATDPHAAGMIFVPLLAFDERGYRAGYGKGYYDRFLKTCRPDALKVGFSFFEPVQIDDVHEGDEKLDLCITPYAVYEF